MRQPLSISLSSSACLTEDYHPPKNDKIEIFLITHFSGCTARLQGSHKVRHFSEPGHKGQVVANDAFLTAKWQHCKFTTATTGPSSFRHTVTAQISLHGTQMQWQAQMLCVFFQRAGTWHNVQSGKATEKIFLFLCGGTANAKTDSSSGPNTAHKAHTNNKVMYTCIQNSSSLSSSSFKYTYFHHLVFFSRGAGRWEAFSNKRQGNGRKAATVMSTTKGLCLREEEAKGSLPA